MDRGDFVTQLVASAASLKHPAPPVLLQAVSLLTTGTAQLFFMRGGASEQMLIQWGRLSRRAQGSGRGSTGGLAGLWAIR